MNQATHPMWQELLAELPSSERARLTLLMEVRAMEPPPPAAISARQPVVVIEVFEEDDLLRAHCGEKMGAGKSLANALLALAMRLRGRESLAPPDSKEGGS